jgi:hypothetical protein
MSRKILEFSLDGNVKYVIERLTALIRLKLTRCEYMLIRCKKEAFYLHLMMAENFGLAWSAILKRDYLQCKAVTISVPQ